MHKLTSLILLEVFALDIFIVSSSLVLAYFAVNYRAAPAISMYAQVASRLLNCTNFLGFAELPSLFLLGHNVSSRTSRSAIYLELVSRF